MQYVGIDWAYRRAAWCAMREGGEIADEGLVPADEDGLAKLVLRVGPEVRACVEMMGRRGVGARSPAVRGQHRERWAVSRRPREEHRRCSSTASHLCSRPRF